MTWNAKVNNYLWDIARLFFSQKVQPHNIYFQISKGFIAFTAILTRNYFL